MWFEPLDTRSPTALYEQIVEQVRAATVRGDLKPGDRLPSIRDLAVELRVNRNTVAQAYRAMREEGMVETNGARGAFVVDATTTPTRRQMREQLDQLVKTWRSAGVDDEQAASVLAAYLAAARRATTRSR